MDLASHWLYRHLCDIRTWAYAYSIHCADALQEKAGSSVMKAAEERLHQKRTLIQQRNARMRQRHKVHVLMHMQMRSSGQLTVWQLRVC